MSYLWLPRFERHYAKFKNALLDKKVILFLKKFSKEEVIFMDKLYYFCVDELTNTPKVWLSKKWVSDKNSKEYTLACISKIKGLNILDFKNIDYNKEEYENAIKKINTISSDTISKIKSSQLKTGWEKSLLTYTLKWQGF